MTTMLDTTANLLDTQNIIDYWTKSANASPIILDMHAKSSRRRTTKFRVAPVGNAPLAVAPFQRNGGSFDIEVGLCCLLKKSR